MDNSHPSIEFNDLSFGYDKPLLQSVSGTLDSGELVVVVGRNGVGKSTLFHVICGLHDPLSGSVQAKGESVHLMIPNERARHIAFVSTHPPQLGGFDVKAYVAMGRHPYLGRFGTLKSNDEIIIDEVIQKLGIQHIASKRLDEISDGERQKANIARALAQECEVIVLDEPTAFLDYPSKLEVMKILKELTQNEGKLIILSTHELPLIDTIADKILLMHDGTAELHDSSDGDLKTLLKTHFGTH